ncbi:MAG TPA: alpha/beta fold hydrolase [Acidobacteriaceae bacterium]
MQKRFQWSDEFFAVALGAASHAVMLRDSLLRVTRGMRRHSLAEAITFASGDRELAAAFVPGEPGVPMLLVCHGIGEKLENWTAVQALLRESGVGSMIFNYSGYGRSTGRIRAEHCDADFVAAYAELRRRVGDELPVFVLGYSMGSGVATQGVPALEPPVAGLFLCEAFDSFHEAACVVGLPRWLLRKVPAVWDTAGSISQLRMPVWVLHSTGDKLFPLTMPRKIVAASHGAAELIVVEGLRHNEPILKAVQRYWEPVLEPILAAKRNGY